MSLRFVAFCCSSKRSAERLLKALAESSTSCHLKFQPGNVPLSVPTHIFHVQRRHLTVLSSRTCQQQKQHNTTSDTGQSASSSIIESTGNSNANLSTHLSGARKVKQAATDASYLVFVLLGGAMLFAIFYYLFAELFSRETPSGIYDESSKICIDNFDVRDALGTPIKVTAESGGRRVFQVKHKYYVEDDRLYLIINYYLQGPKNKGTVYCKVFKNAETGKFEYESILVKLDYSHLGQKKIVVLNNQTASKNH